MSRTKQTKGSAVAKKAEKKSAESAAAPAVTITAFKGFNAQMQCHGGYQFKVGETYEHAGRVAVCESGFHSCENPIDVWSYYPPGDGNLFAEVEASGEIARHSGDSKVASARLHVKAVLTLPDFIGRAVEWLKAHCEPATSNHATGDSSASSATGASSASSATGDSSASSATGASSASSATGASSASSATGASSASSATGYRSASSATGASSASSATGASSASSATGYSSASSATGASSASSATGYSSASSATGDRSASLSTGCYSSSEITPEKSGEPLHAVAIATGYQSLARAPAGSAIVLCERNNQGELLHIRASKVGENGVKPDTWYSLKDGEFAEWTEAA